MKNNFQTILLGIFLAFFVFSVLIFSGLLPIGKKSDNKTTIVGNVIVWGTFEQSLLSDIFQNLVATNKDLNISYIQKDKDTYEEELLRAFANDQGPDLFFVSNKTLLQNESFIYEIPYSSYPKKIFQDTFIEGANVFIDTNGIDAFPVVADPLMVFYNKRILTNQGISSPPIYWDEIFDLNTAITKKRPDGTITESMIALGAYSNITNAKDIIAMFFLQSGNKIFSRANDQIFVDIDTTNNLNTELVDFFNSFSNPLSQAYSWNRGLPESKEMFTGNNLLFYIGYASELFEIEEVNPNLSFDVSEIFQIRNIDKKVVAGDIYALAINKNSKNLQGASGVLFNLISDSYVDQFAKALSLPPALKANLLENPEDPYLYSFYKSAISLNTWLETDQKKTSDVFKRFTENLASGRVSSKDAISRLQSELDLTIQR